MFDEMRYKLNGVEIDHNRNIGIIIKIIILYYYIIKKYISLSIKWSSLFDYA